MIDWLANRKQWGSALLVLVAVLPLLVALFGVPVIPTHDGPKNLYASHLFAHAEDPAFSSGFERSSPVTAVGFALVYGVFESVLPWRSAYALATLVGVLAMPIGVWLIARALDARRAPLGLVALGAAWQWTSHMGFVNYTGSVGFGFVAVGLALTGSARWSSRRELGVYACIFAACLYHPFGGQFASVAVFVQRLLHTSRARVVREVGAVIVGCCPAVVVTLLAQANLEDAAIRAPTASPLDLSFAERLEGFGRWFLAGPIARSAFVLGVAAVGLLATIAGLLRGPRDRRVGALLAISLVGFLGVLLAPMHSGLWQYFQPRFTPIAVLALVPLVPLERLGPRAWTFAVGAFTLFAVASNGWVAHHHHDHAEREAALYAALGHAAPAPGRRLLPIVARVELTRDFQRRRDLEVPSAGYVMNAGHLFAIDRRAVTPYGFDSLPNVHLATTRQGVLWSATPVRDYGGRFAPDADETERAREIARLASFAPGYDDVLFYGEPRDVDAFVSHGFEVERRDRGLLIASFRGCPATVTLRGLHVQGALHVGFRGADRFGLAIPLRDARPAVIPIERASCVGLRAVLDAKDASGAAARCKPLRSEPDPQGVAAIETADGERDLVCDVELSPAAPSAAPSNEEAAPHSGEP